MTDNSRRPLLLTVTEVARALKLERSKVYMFMEEGILDAFRLGGHWRIKASSVEQLLAASPLVKLETITEVIDGNQNDFGPIDLPIGKPTLQRSSYVKR